MHKYGLLLLAAILVVPSAAHAQAQIDADYWMALASDGVGDVNDNYFIPVQTNLDDANSAWDDLWSRWLAFEPYATAFEKGSVAGGASVFSGHQSNALNARDAGYVKLTDCWNSVNDLGTVFGAHWWYSFGNWANCIDECQRMLEGTIANTSTLHNSISDFTSAWYPLGDMWQDISDFEAYLDFIGA